MKSLPRDNKLKVLTCPQGNETLDKSGMVFPQPCSYSTNTKCTNLDVQDGMGMQISYSAAHVVIVRLVEVGLGLYRFSRQKIAAFSLSFGVGG